MIPGLGSPIAMVEQTPRAIDMDTGSDSIERIFGPSTFLELWSIKPSSLVSRIFNPPGLSRPLPPGSR